MFNKCPRTVNSLKSSGVGVANYLLKIILEFVYRTVFLRILSETYLGLNGLFTNILSILSLAELGIGTAIVYRLYQPIHEDNSAEVAAIMDFYKKVYRIIAIIVAVLGLCLMPFIKFLIKSDAEIPFDINIYIVYALFLVQSVSSYFFVYRQSILNADQRGYTVSLINIVLNVFRYSGQIVVLFLTKNFIATLAVAICLQIAVNFAVSVWIGKSYRFVFCLSEKITPELKKQIFKDTQATMLHSIGGKIVFSTDNIILSACVGLAATGIYSNYSLVIVAIQGLISQIITAFAGSVGNLHAEGNREHTQIVYYRVLFIGLWLSVFCTICLSILLNPFMILWQGEKLVFDYSIVLVLCASFFINSAKQAFSPFINGCGLFVRDKIRPLIEAGINLVVSLVLVLKIGVIGIFIGTIVSSLCTVWWREPYLLHKYEFRSSMKKYWWMYFAAVCLAAGCGAGTYFICNLLPLNLWYFILRMVICLVLPNVVILACTFWTPECKYYLTLAKSLLHKLFAGKSKDQQ